MKVWVVCYNCGTPGIDLWTDIHGVYLDESTARAFVDGSNETQVDGYFDMEEYDVIA